MSEIFSEVTEFVTGQQMNDNVASIKQEIQKGHNQEWRELKFRRIFADTGNEAQRAVPSGNVSGLFGFTCYYIIPGPTNGMAWQLCSMFWQTNGIIKLGGPFADRDLTTILAGGALVTTAAGQSSSFAPSAPVRGSIIFGGENIFLATSETLTNPPVLTRLGAHVIEAAADKIGLLLR